MTNEVKEILDYIEYNTDWNSHNDIEILRKHITNLQETIETIKNTNKLLIQQKAHLQDDLDMLDNRLDKAIEYINVELFNSNIDWVRNNNGCVSGSDLPADAIFPIIDILKGEDNDN